MRNLHKLYYKDYFADVDFADLGSDKSKKAVLEANRKLTEIVDPKYLNVPSLGSVDSFELEVLYPGLITGIGIQHEARVEGEFKLGLHLDYTTGLPVIYGSTVKGVLRSYFKEVYDGPGVVDVINDIFEGIGPNGKPKSIYARDIFYDAVISKANAANLILCGDSLAPHGGDSHTDPFVEPVPISFVKIAPGVKLLFRFKLCDTLDAAGNVVISAEKKKTDFLKILTLFGIGAKTNVGYGQLKCSMEMEQYMQTQKGKDLLAQADASYASGDYSEATDLYTQASECLDANSSEYKKCISQIAAIKGNIFNKHITNGDALLGQGKLDEARQEFEAAKAYAEGIGEFNEQRKNDYNLGISKIEMKRLQQMACQPQRGDGTFADYIANINKMTTLIARTRKWKEDGNVVDPQVLAEKVDVLRQSVKKRDEENFKKLCEELYKIAGLG